MDNNQVKLTPKEIEILDLLLQGCGNEEIGYQLTMKERTVKAHCHRLFNKFHITNGIKRVKLAMVFRQLRPQTEPIPISCKFSDREWKLIELLAKGLKNKEMASIIGTTENTVKNYLREVYDKAGMWNRLELALWFKDHKRTNG